MRVLMLGHESSAAVMRKYAPEGVILDVVPLTKVFCGWDGTSLHLVHADTRQSLGDYDAAYLHA